MFGEDKQTDITMFFDGKKIAGVQSIDMEIGRDVEMQSTQKHLLFKGLQGTIEMKDVEIDMDFFNKMISNTEKRYDVVASGSKLIIPKGKKMPKKKRLRKKFIKKHTHKVETTYRNVTIS